MVKRLKLSQILHETLGTNNVYFQPPADKKLSFPCIVYEFNRYNTEFADNDPYHLVRQFRITYIDSNPDNEMVDKIAQLPQCVYERSYIANNRYHYTYRISL